MFKSVSLWQNWSHYKLFHLNELIDDVEDLRYFTSSYWGFTISWASLTSCNYPSLAFGSTSETCHHPRPTHLKTQKVVHSADDDVHGGGVTHLSPQEVLKV